MSAKLSCSNSIRVWRRQRPPPSPGRGKTLKPRLRAATQHYGVQARSEESVCDWKRIRPKRLDPPKADNLKGCYVNDQVVTQVNAQVAS